MTGKLLTFEEAKRTLETHFKVPDLGEEEAVLLEAANRTLYADVASPIDIPAYSTSKVNGYALKAAQTNNASDDAPISLAVAGCVAVGENPKTVVADGEAIEIQAGAVLPEGADAVVAVEDVECVDAQLQIYTAASAGENVVQKGSDVAKGTIVLSKGQVLGSSEIGVLAALGCKSAKVQKIPMVTVLSVGTDIAELGKPLPPGKNYDLNAYCLCTAVMECGAKPVYFGVAAPNQQTLTQTLKAVLASSDMVIACGAETSVAEAADILAKGTVVANGIAVKPVKTFAAAYIEGKPILCLPQNPSAALLAYYLFARTLVQRLAGRPASPPKTVVAVAGAKMFGAKGSLTFQQVILAFDEQCRLIAQPIPFGGAVSSLAQADGFVELPENQENVEAGQEVAVLLYRGLAGKA